MFQAIKSYLFQSPPPPPPLPLPKVPLTTEFEDRLKEEIKKQFPSPFAHGVLTETMVTWAKYEPVRMDSIATLQQIGYDVEYWRKEALRLRRLISEQIKDDKKTTQATS